MSAEVLRKAASLMRERAEAARPSPWVAGRFEDTYRQPSVKSGEDYWIAECDSPFSGGDKDATHIASWHPAVAVAVADWLDATALTLGRRPSWATPVTVERDYAEAYAVARAYLGSDQ